MHKFPRLLLLFSVIFNLFSVSGTAQQPIFEVEPFLDAVYGQVNCYDIDAHPIYPTNYYTPNHYAPGCVAISMVTMMQYYEWPLKGLGIHQDIDAHGNSTGTYVVNYEEESYNWDLILPRYHYMTSSEAEQQELAKLTYDVAIAIDMEFENTGSTSNVNRIPNAGKEHFSYASVYKSFTAPSFWANLDSNIVHHLPVTLAIDAPNGAGHSCVVDGMRVYENNPTLYHLNLGWWGDVNGWYAIKDGYSAGGYTSISGGVFDFIPKPFMEKPIKLNEDYLYQLSWGMPDNVIVQAYELRQKINNGLWHTIETNELATSIEVQAGAYDDYYFEIRAKIDGKWYSNGWSNRVKAEDIIIQTNDPIAGKFTMFPNPCFDNLTIHLPEQWASQSINVQVLTPEGKQVLSRKTNAISGVIQLPCQTLNSGIYFIRLIKDNKQVTLKMTKH